MTHEQEAINQVPASRGGEPAVALAPDRALPLETISAPEPAGRNLVGSTRVPALLKRLVDVILSLLGLILLLPIWLLFALAIRLDSRGPVLFRQRRIGHHGEEFGMFKFRTMFDGADLAKDEIRHMNEAAEGLFKIRDDPRVTRVGSLLRSTLLDEAPQLLNVLAGQMSLVGPRPLIPEEDALIEGPFRARLEMRPGMTGPWQVAGASAVPIREMVRLDRDYVQSWSLLSDLGLIIRTIPHVLRRRGI